MIHGASPADIFIMDLCFLAALNATASGMQPVGLRVGVDFRGTFQQVRPTKASDVLWSSQKSNGAWLVKSM